MNRIIIKEFKEKSYLEIIKPIMKANNLLK